MEGAICRVSDYDFGVCYVCGQCASTRGILLGLAEHCLEFLEDGQCQTIVLVVRVLV